MRRNEDRQDGSDAEHDAGQIRVQDDVAVDSREVQTELDGLGFLIGVFGTSDQEVVSGFQAHVVFGQ